VDAQLSTLLLSLSSMGIAQTIDDICKPQGVVAGFYNGVWNTTADAGSGRSKLESVIGTKTATGEEVRWEVFYNTTTTQWADVVETFNQRASAQDAAVAERWELFWEAISGNGASTGWTGVIADSTTSLAGFFSSLGNDILARTVATLTFSLNNPPTLANYAEHRAKIDNFALEGKKFLLVAHSQGNLFVIPSYDYAVSKVGAQAVKVVHIAPASPTLKGDYTLANLDLVINALRSTGAVPANNVSIPGILQRESPVDASGHELIGTYLRTGMDPRAKVVADATAALSALLPPTLAAPVAVSGFFTVTLSWSGAGDVDLYTYEPGGSTVFFGSQLGASGSLDVDNTVGFGPEHYYASCDATKIATGSYRVAIDNYSVASPANLTATLQVSSYSGGVLLTKTLGVPLAPSFGQSPVDALVVEVTQDSTTKKYAVSAR
jgi:hypothetical protein